MIIQLVTILFVGVAAGWTLGYLMRGNHRQSPWIVVAGVVGAALAVGVRESMGTRGILVAIVTALAGALAVSFATRLSMFAREA